MFLVVQAGLPEEIRVDKAPYLSAYEKTFSPPVLITDASERESCRGKAVL